MENKIKEILSNRADYYIDNNGKSHDIIRGHPDDIMDEIVKLFAIPDVVGRSEQLVCDHKWINNSFDQFGFLQEQICDKCGAKQSVP